MAGAWITPVDTLPSEVLADLLPSHYGYKVEYARCAAANGANDVNQYQPTMSSNFLNNWFARKPTAQALALLLASTSCASLPPAGAKFDNFSDYAESVFKHQNQVISRMMMLNDNEQLPDSDALEESEQAMHDACHLLNEYAEMEIEGEFISPFFTRTVQASIEGCDKSIQNMERQIDSLITPIPENN